MGKKASKLVRIVFIILLFSSVILAACTKQAADSGGNSVNKTDATKNPETVYEYKWMGPNYPFKDGTPIQKYMEEKFNIKVVPVRVDEAQKLNLLISSGDIPDLMVITDPTKITEYARNNALAEVPVDLIKNNIPKYYDIMIKHDPKAFTYGGVNKKNYALPTGNANASPRPIAIRADWLKNVGAEIPVTLQQLEDVFVKFRNNDPNQNGKKDTYALSMPSDNVNAWFQTIFAAFGTQPFIWNNRNDQLVYGFTENETKEALKLLNKWKKMDLIDPEFVTDKNRTNGKDDVVYKFASGRIGYLDNLSFDDHQWDNDGQLNAKWVGSHPEWKAFFDKPENAYVTESFTKIPTSGPQPVYVNIKPPIGPNGKSGTYKDNAINKYIVFGKQLEKDQSKLIKLLKIIETITTDEDTYVNIEIGPENVAWVWNQDKQRIYKDGWTKSQLYHPQGRNIGSGQFFDITFNTNPAMLTVFGGPRATQRYDKTRKLITDIPAIQNAVKAPLPSESKYIELNTMVQEYIMKAILGEVDIDATFDATVKKWKDTGGDVLTKDANDWFSNIK